MDKKKLDRIIRNHLHWLKKDCEGWENMKADLSGLDLSHADLSGVNLSHANLSHVILSNAGMTGADLSHAELEHAILSNAGMAGANLSYADLFGTNLTNAYLTGAILSHAILSNADMTGVNLSNAILSHADIIGTNLSGVNLSHADLSHANLEYADIYTASFDKKDEIRKGIILTKPMKGYKKTDEGIIITVEIPAGAVVFSINGRKCRTNMATIINTAGHELLHAIYDPEFTYRQGQKIIIPDFDLRYNVECGKGFHFLRTKKEAKAY